MATFIHMSIFGGGEFILGTLQFESSTCSCFQRSSSMVHMSGRLAGEAFRRSIEADPTHSDSWNGLGAVLEDPLAQQHCWVRAVQLAHNPNAWANLGMFYVRWGLDVQVRSVSKGKHHRQSPTPWRALFGVKYCTQNATEELLCQVEDLFAYPFHCSLAIGGGQPLAIAALRYFAISAVYTVGAVGVVGVVTYSM